MLINIFSTVAVVSLWPLLLAHIEVGLGFMAFGRRELIIVTIFLWVALSKLVSLIKIGDSVVESSIELIVGLIIIIVEVELSRSVRPSLACTILSLRLFLSCVRDKGERTPLIVADHTVTIMIASSQDRLNIFLLGVVVVSAQVID